MRGVTVIVPPSLWILAYGSCDENSTLSPLTLALMELRSAPDSLSPCGAFGFQGLLKNASRWKLRSNSSASSTRMSLRMFSTNSCTSIFFSFGPRLTLRGWRGRAFRCDARHKGTRHGSPRWFCGPGGASSKQSEEA